MQISSEWTSGRAYSVTEFARWVKNRQNWPRKAPKLLPYHVLTDEDKEQMSKWLDNWWKREKSRHPGGRPRKIVHPRTLAGMSNFESWAMAQELMLGVPYKVVALWHKISLRSVQRVARGLGIQKRTPKCVTQ